MRILVWQHIQVEPPALLADVIRQQGHQVDTTLVQQPGPKSHDGYDGLIVMGGPQSANDVHLSYIAAELELLRQAIAADVPVLGVCLGAQLLAKAAGAKVLPSPVRELGWYKVLPTSAAKDDPLFALLPQAGLHVFQWHGETFSLPRDATLLATAQDVPHQAFRTGSCQYGLQFHVEADEALIRSWIAAGDDERRHLGKNGVAGIYADTHRYAAGAHGYCRNMCQAWLALIEGR